MRVLLVEDEAVLRDTLKARLVEAGFTVDVAQDGEEGVFAGLEYPLDVAIVDLGLPKLPGLEVIRRLRAARKTYPILILTARDNWQDKVEGLQAGADDYVAKPFHFEEVLARLQALLRRAGGWASPELKCGPILLDTRAQTVKVGEAAVDLTTFEYRILEHLMLRAGEVISKTELTERLYDQDFERDSNVIEVLVGRLRRKLDPQDELKPIETLRGRGYRFALAARPGGAVNLRAFAQPAAPVLGFRAARAVFRRDDVPARFGLSGRVGSHAARITRLADGVARGGRGAGARRRLRASHARYGSATDSPAIGPVRADPLHQAPVALALDGGHDDGFRAAAGTG